MSKRDEDARSVEGTVDPETVMAALPNERRMPDGTHDRVAEIAAAAEMAVRATAIDQDAEKHSQRAEEAVAQSTPLSDAAMARGSFYVSSIQAGKPDGEGRKVTKVYTRKAGEFAVYRVEDGDVWVQFADKAEVADKQRAVVSKVCSVRWEIDSLADGWKNGDRYHDELGAGLALALGGDPDGALSKLNYALAKLREERAIAGRIQYMGLAALSACSLLLALYLFSEYIYPFVAPVENVWLAGKAGLMGAFFSVAIFVRRREVALDCAWKNNLMEGAVRLSVGVIAGGFLLLAIGSGLLPRVMAGDMNLAANTAKDVLSWQAVVVLGFVGGFLERLVPSLLEKTQTPPSAAQPTK